MACFNFSMYMSDSLVGASAGSFTEYGYNVDLRNTSGSPGSGDCYINNTCFQTGCKVHLSPSDDMSEYANSPLNVQGYYQDYYKENMGWKIQPIYRRFTQILLNNININTQTIFTLGK